MPINETAALAIQRKRGLGVVPVPGGGWRAHTASGAAISPTIHTDPTAALEEADILLAKAEERREEVSLRTLRFALESAQYVPWPQLNPADGTMSWGVMRVSDREVVSVKSGWIAAAMEIARLVGERMSTGVASTGVASVADVNKGRSSTPNGNNS